MNKPLRILLVQESSGDNVLLHAELEKIGSMNHRVHRVETLSALNTSLKQNKWDIIVADYDNQEVKYTDALRAVSNLQILIPLIIVSSEIGAEAAVSAIKAGVSDIVTKDNLVRLKDSVEQVLREAELQRQVKEIYLHETQLTTKSSLSSNLMVGIASYIAIPTCDYHPPEVDVYPTVSINQQLYLNSLQRDLQFVSHLTDDLGKLEHVAGFANHKDTSQSQRVQETLKEVMQQLQRTQKQLVETEKMSALGQLLAGIAHEINNPVNSIYNNLDFVCEYIQNILILLELYQKQYPNPTPNIQAQAQNMDWDFVKEDLPKMLSSMKLCTERVYEIILGLRNFSRIDQKEIQTVDIHKIIDNVVLILQHRLKPNGIKLGIEIIKEYDNLPLVKCYPGQLNQVFMNLIANAIDALEEFLTIDKSCNANIEKSNCHQGKKGKICISTKYLEDKSCVQIQISDNGPGIPEENQNQIFDAFFTTKPVGKGTGLGLSITQQIIVEKHGGELHCHSAPNKGTEFFIQLPV